MAKYKNKKTTTFMKYIVNNKFFLFIKYPPRHGEDTTLETIL